MLLKSLRLHNFRQYKGTQVVCFSADPEKNVTVILGDNTYGKTTLLQSFYWCFYGKVQLDNPDDLLNYDVMNELAAGDSEDVEVEIELEHKGLDYTITRTRTYSNTGGKIQAGLAHVSMGYRRDDGQTEPVKDARIETTIKQILPEGLSSYFFFDTERVANVSARKDLGDSVRGLLGLTVLENAIKHLGTKNQKRTVIGKLYASMNVDGDKRAENARQCYEAALDRREEIGERLDECKREITHLTARKTQLDEILRDDAKAKDLERQKNKTRG